MGSNCCIMTLDRAVNQRFPAQDTPVKLSGSNHVVKRKCVGAIKWYMQMPTRDMGSLCFESVSACSFQSSRKIENCGCGGMQVGLWRDRLSTPHRKRRQMVLKLTQSDQKEVMGQFSSLSSPLSLRLSLSFLHTYRSFDLFLE